MSKPINTKNLIILITLLGIFLGNFFYWAQRYEPRLNSPPNPVDGAIGKLQGMEALLWANFKLTPNISFETVAELDNEIVSGTKYGDWDTNIGPDCKWDAGHPTSSGGNFVCKAKGWRERRVKLIRLPATPNAPAVWFEDYTP